jgi:hypothetical protein
MPLIEWLDVVWDRDGRLHVMGPRWCQGGCVGALSREQDDVAQLSLHLGVDLHVVTRRSSKRS